MFDIKNADSQILREIESVSLFDFYRIVDVDAYLVYDWQDGKLIATSQRCYEVWKRDDACKNCISRTCVLEGRRMIKLEYFEDQIYLITAVPIVLESRRFSLELIGIVTNSLVVNDSSHTENFSAQGIISQMNDIAVRDQCTGIYNKRYAEQELSKSVLEWKRGKHLTIGILDIDHFKQVNDTYGHVKGDEVLFMIAKLMSDCVKSGDGWVSRIGGDEFMLFWKDISPEAAGAAVQELLEKIGAHSFIKNDVSFNVTASIGLAEYRPGMASWKEFLDEADQIMYCEKKEKYSEM